MRSRIALTARARQGTTSTVVADLLSQKSNQLRRVLDSQLT
jgi:hypothetical protein